MELSCDSVALTDPIAACQHLCVYVSVIVKSMSVCVCVCV